MLDNIFSKESFSKEVEEFILSSDCSVMDAIIHIAEKKNLEIEGVSKFLSKNLIERLQCEAEDLNMIEKRARLPI